MAKSSRFNTGLSAPRLTGADMASARHSYLKGTKWALLQVLLIAALVLWIFWPALHGQWIGDDTWYIVDNPLMNDPARLWKAWFQLGSWVEYYPIEETVQWLQWQLWHNETFGYHLTNVVLHLASALLV